MGNAGSANIGEYREMKLNSEVLECSSNLDEVPSFVQVRQIAQAAGSVIHIQLDKATSQAFFICDNGYFAIKIDSNTGMQSSVLDYRPYTDIDPGASGQFMGFQPSLSADTFLLLQHNAVYPIQFQPEGTIRLHPTKSIIRRQDGAMMWAVREFAPN